MNTTLAKYLQVLLIVLACAGVDQWTKHVASDRLASYRSGYFSHPIILTVPDAFDGKSARELIEHEFGDSNTPAEISDIMRGVTNDGAVQLAPDRKLKAGDIVEVRRREIVVIPGYFDFQYTRNEGAAFSFLADSDAAWRKPFFVVVGVMAVAIIFWILRGVAIRQQLLIWALALICGGAIGNLIDRVNLGFVVDFIVWKWTDAYRWPTFNLADAFIVVGVALMLIEMIRDMVRERQGGGDLDEAPAAD